MLPIINNRNNNIPRKNTKYICNVSRTTMIPSVKDYYYNIEFRPNFSFQNNFFMNKSQAKNLLFLSHEIIW